MGGAKFLGRETDTGLPKSEEELAFQYFFYWVVGGLVISFGLAILIFQTKPNFLIPIGFYFIIGILLFCRYLYIDLKGGNVKDAD